MSLSRSLTVASAALVGVLAVVLLGSLAAGAAPAGPAPVAQPVAVAAPASSARPAQPAPTAQPARSSTPAQPARPAPTASEAVSETPCAPTAEACVDLSAQRAWLTDGAGNITYGPVGALGGTRADPTPTGTFSVDYKDRDHVSNLYDADMPNSVFFAPAIAFHEGSLSDRSHGCIHLGGKASRTFYSRLSPGDTVQVVR